MFDDTRNIFFMPTRSTEIGAIFILFFFIQRKYVLSFSQHIFFKNLKLGTNCTLALENRVLQGKKSSEREDRNELNLFA